VYIAYWVAYRVFCNSELCSFLAMAMELYELLLTVKLMQPSVVPGIHSTGPSKESCWFLGATLVARVKLLDSIFALE
jgi:hypothetical protein